MPTDDPSESDAAFAVSIKFFTVFAASLENNPTLEEETDAELTREPVTLARSLAS